MQSFVQFNPLAGAEPIKAVEVFLGKAGMDLAPTDDPWIRAIRYARDGKPARVDDFHVVSIKNLRGALDVYDSKAQS